MATLKASVELTPTRLLSMMRSTVFTNEFPFLSDAYQTAVASAQQSVPSDCSECTRRRLMREAMGRVSPNYDELHRKIMALSTERKLRLKTLLQTKEVRIPGYLRDSKRITMKF